MTETLLIPGLIEAMNMAAAGTAAKNAVSIKNDKTKKVLGDGEKTPKETKDYGWIDISNLSGKENENLWIILSMGGIDTPRIKNIMKRGILSPYDIETIENNDPDVLVELMKAIPGDWGERMKGMAESDYDKTRRGMLSSPSVNPQPDDDDDKKKKKEKKKKDLEDDLAEIEKSRAKRAKAKVEFNKNDPKSISKRAVEENTKRTGQFERIAEDDPKLLNNSPAQKMEKGAESLKKAINNGTKDQWEYGHVSPTSNVPIRP